MSTNDKKGGSSPVEDRTLLDPLSSEELQELRRARERARQASAGVGPDANDPNLGDAPTRTVPSADRPQLSGQNEGNPQPPASVFTGTVSTAGDEPTLLSSSVTQGFDFGASVADPRSDVQVSAVEHANGPVVAASPDATLPAEPPTSPMVPQVDSMPAPQSQPQPKAGQTGFGENTLMWMQPPKASLTAPQPVVESTPEQVRAARGNQLRSLVVVGLAAAMLAAVVAVVLSGGKTGTIELRTEPGKAVVSIDGRVQSELTPVQVRMAAGEHSIQLSHEGYVTKTIQVMVEPEKDIQHRIELEPLSAPGFRTVSISVQPVAATITLDDLSKASTRSLMVPNVDPGKRHLIKVEASNYRTIYQEIAPGELQKQYNFVLQNQGGEE